MPPPPQTLARSAADLSLSCAELAANGGQLLTFFGADERDSAGEFALYAVFLDRQGQTLAHVIREAVDEYLAEGPDPETALRETFGSLPDLRVPSRDEWDRG